MLRSRAFVRGKAEVWHFKRVRGCFIFDSVSCFFAASLYCQIELPKQFVVPCRVRYANAGNYIFDSLDFTQDKNFRFANRALAAGAVRHAQGTMQALKSLFASSELSFRRT